MTDIAEPDFTPQMIDAAGVSIATYSYGPDDGRPVVFVHGWPEIAYSWKEQMRAVGDAGYHAIALDLRGFGASQAPEPVEDYDINHLCNDLAAVLDAYGAKDAIFCGHDWGGIIVWPMAQLKPARVAGVIGLCTAHNPPLAVPPIEKIRAGRGDAHYIVQFNDNPTIETLFEADPEKFFRIMMQKAPKRAVIEKLGNRLFDLPGRFKHGPTPELDQLVMGKDDLEVFINAYKKSGFRGGVNLYRNVDRDNEILSKVDPKIAAPCLWIGAEDDVFLPVEYANHMDRHVGDLEKHVVSDSGHWIMWEQPGAVNALILDWLQRRYPR
ncbi:MAG: alpha/beta hydrolase [Pseudomonadota bacterium]